MATSNTEQISAFAMYAKKKVTKEKKEPKIKNKFSTKSNNQSKGILSSSHKNGKKVDAKKRKLEVQVIQTNKKVITNGIEKSDFKKSKKAKNINGIVKKRRKNDDTETSSSTVKDRILVGKKKHAKKVESDDEPPTLVLPTFHPSTSQDNNDSNLKKNYVSLKGKQVDVEMNELLSDLNKSDPSPEGYKVFKWLIHPMKPKVFFEEYWENQVLHIERNNEGYYQDILTTERLDDIFREFPLQYTKNVDVVSYENGVKEVHNGEGRVIPAALYDYYLNGCSIRVLNPQTYDQRVHAVLAALQEYFGCMAGANVYLTPPGSQGFAPHYDDIEAFVIQLEGRKRWRLYGPKGADVLARESSPNLKHEDIGEPFMELTLNAGDILYFPRGTIHEGRTDKDSHSFHITISVYQHNSYADLLESIIPDALRKAANENVEFRVGLPINCLRHLGYVNKDTASTQRQEVVSHVKSLMKIFMNYIDVDTAADKLGRRFMYDSLPPVLSKLEARNTSKYDGDFMKDGRILNRVEIDLDTEVRLVRYHCIRVVADEDPPKIYYNVDNARVYHGEEEQVLIIANELLPCVKALQNRYPQFIKLEDLPGADHLAKAQLVSDLWEQGILVSNGPLNPVGDDEGDSAEEDDENLSDNYMF